MERRVPDIAKLEIEGCWWISRLNVSGVVSVRRISTSVEGDGHGYDGQWDRRDCRAELRAAGYMESTVGQYAKTIKALTQVRLGA